MRVLMLNYEFPPLGGGAANANKHILKEMSEIEDLKVDLVTSSEEGYSEESFSENINIYRLDVKKKDIHFWRQIEILRYLFKGFWKSRGLVAEKDYDLVHAWFGFPCGLMAMILGKPYIVSLRGSDVPGYNERFSIQYRFLTPLIKIIWRNAEKVVANSSGLKELARETMEISFDVIPNGVDTEKFRTSDSETGEVLHLLCVARLTSRKRIRDIIESIKDLEKVDLTLVGEGPEEEELNKLVSDLDIEDRVEFRGYVPHEKLPEIYNRSDIFILPSLKEGMSNTILEAMASGLPIITTDTGGTEELIKDNGIIVDKKRPESIKNAIKYYQEDETRIRTQGEKSRQIAVDMSWENVAGEYMDIYRAISQAKNQPDQ